MITIEQFKEAGIEIDNALMGNTAIEWIANNTTLTVDTNNVETVSTLPFSAKLFIVKFNEISSMRAGVTSESISGLSQSFSNTDNSSLIWQYACDLLEPWLKPTMQVVTAKRRWYEQCT